MPRNPNWTREETIIAFNLYCKIPFKESNSRHPEIIKYAQIIGRSPSSLNMKIGNLGRLDPELQRQGIVGLKNGGKLDKVIWDEFNNNWETLAFQSEALIARYLDKSVEEVANIETEDLPIGRERDAIVRVRVNQSFFRSTILSSYSCRCCITGLSVPRLLNASHIIPWRDKNHIHQRLNPRNGLCLNSLHDKAFDEGYITVTPDYKVKISDHFKDFDQDKAISDLFLKYENQAIMLPDKFLPSKEFLDYHYEKVYRK